MKKKIIKSLSTLLVISSLFTTKAFAGTWEPHEGYNGFIMSWEYYNDDGSIPIGWKYIDGYWYYFEYGITRTTPLEENGEFYYFNSNAQLITNQYVKVGQGLYGVYYWANSDGSIDFDNSWLPEGL